MKTIKMLKTIKFLSGDTILKNGKIYTLPIIPHPKASYYNSDRVVYQITIPCPNTNHNCETCLFEDEFIFVNEVK